MQPSIEYFLKVLADKSELKENQLAWVIANNYKKLNLASKDKFYESLVPYYRVAPLWNPPETILIGDKTIEEIESYFSKDFRLKEIYIKNFRGYPSGKDGLPFGVSFEENGKPLNAIILGSNGVGKSSLYQAIEYLYCQRIGEAELRTYNNSYDDDSPFFREYSAHDNLEFKEVFCQANTMCGEYNLHGEKMFSKNIKSKLNPNTHFISDYDIYSLGQLDYIKSGERSFHNLIASSLGLKEYLSFNKLMNQLKDYKRIKEVKELNAKRDNQKRIEKDISDWEAEIKTRQIKIDEIQKKLSTSNTIDTSDQTLLKNLLNREISFTVVKDELTEYISQFNKNYDQYRGQNLDSYNQKETEFLCIGLELLETSENCPFCLNSNTKIEDLKVHTKERIQNNQRFHRLRESLIQNNENLLACFKELRDVLGRINENFNKELLEIKRSPKFFDLYNFNQSYHEKLFDKELIKLLNKLDESMSKSKATDEGFHCMFDFLSEFWLLLDKSLSSFNENLKSYIIDRKSFLERIKVTINLSLTSNDYDTSIILKKEIDDLELKIKTNKQNLENNRKEIDQLEQQYLIYDCIKKDSILYIKILNNEINSIVNSSFDPINETITAILNDYLKDDNVQLIIEKIVDDYDQDTGQVLSEIIISKLKHVSKDVIMHPNKYFNTFRYRLFCMMVGISVAIASRIRTKINLPLVLDDVFYASDFENRTTIVDFLKKLYSLFEKYTPSCPLQLILFTHDEIISDCAFNAIADLDKSRETIFARLFPYKESIKNGNYLDLVFKLPKELPQYIINQLNLNN
jgi:energy-coupling factor transporter ATP-binding protein EcfA2